MSALGLKRVTSPESWLTNCMCHSFSLSVPWQRNPRVNLAFDCSVLQALAEAGEGMLPWEEFRRKRDVS
jgi:hypothetical protein